MPLYKLQDYYPDHRETLSEHGINNIDSYKVYTQGEDQIGTVKDILVDQSGRFRYVVVDTGPWIFGKNVLLPIGLAHFDYDNHRIFVDGLSKEQVENLPAFSNAEAVDETYENSVRQQYRAAGQQRSQRQFMRQPADSKATDRSGHDAIYDREPTLYGMSETDNHQALKLYEERLVTQRNRIKTGSVSVGKHVESETAEVNVPIEKERVVIERNDASGQTLTGQNPQFEDGEVARFDVYEDNVDIEKKAYVREEVSVHKETDREQFKAKETVRREELDINTEGNPNVNR